jgi:hypothetical protein
MKSSANSVFTIANSAAGRADLDVDRNGSFGGTLATGGRFTVAAGGMDVTGSSDIRGNVDMHNNVIENIGDAGTDFTSNGGLNLAGELKADDVTADGDVNFSDAKMTIPNGTMLPPSCSKGQVFIKTDGQAVTVGGQNATAYVFACVSNNDWKPAIN